MCGCNCAGPCFEHILLQNRGKTLEASTFHILFKYGLCLVANQEPTYSSRAPLQAWP